MLSFLEAFILFQIAYWSLTGISYVVTYIRGRFYVAGRTDKPANNVVLVIVTKASKNVRDSLYHTIDNVKNIAQKHNIDFKIVVDEGSDLQSELELIYRDHIIVVPKDYTRGNLVGKGRAIQYFVENFLKEDYWYAFVDDDNLILTDDFLYEIPYYERDERYAAANPVLVPRWGRSVITYILDAMRYLMDISYYRFFIGIKGKPLIGLHGELLVVRGKVLKEIGFKKRSIVEDFYFAGELIRRGYKTWQSRTKISILSPNSLKDFFIQRGRWFTGIISELRGCDRLERGKCPGIPWNMRLYSSIMLGTWIISPAGAMVWWVIWPLLILFLRVDTDLPLSVGYVYAALTLIGALFYGFYLSHIYKYVKARCFHRPSRRRSIKTLIAVLLSILLSIGLFFYQLIDTISWAIGFLLYKNKNKFVVINKNISGKKTLWDRICS